MFPFGSTFQQLYCGDECPLDINRHARQPVDSGLRYSSIRQPPLYPESIYDTDDSSDESIESQPTRRVSFSDVDDEYSSSDRSITLQPTNHKFRYKPIVQEPPFNKRRVVYSYIPSRRSRSSCLIYRYQIRDALISRARLAIPTREVRTYRIRSGRRIGQIIVRQTDVRIGRGVIDAIHGLIYSSPCSGRYASRLIDTIIKLWSYRPTTIRIEHVYEAKRIIALHDTD